MKSRPNFIKNLHDVAKEPHYLDEPSRDYRSPRRLGKATGAERIGVNYCYLEPGQVSSKFHYHTREEEFFFLITGQATLRYGDDHYVLSPGDSVSILPGGPAHHLCNDFDKECIYIAIGMRDPEDSIVYPDEGIIQNGNEIRPLK